VFVGDAGAGFDLHSGAPLAEVSVKQSKPTKTGPSTVTIDLSSIDVGFGPGVIPASWTVYARGHIVYSGPAPTADNTYVFGSLSTADGFGTPLVVRAAAVAESRHGHMSGRHPALASDRFS
jgi:hypothetical protein